MSIAKLREALKGGKVVFGLEKTLKNLKLGKVKTVFLSSNCSDEMREEIKNYDVEVIELSEPSDEIALICKRPHAISVLSC